MFGLLKVSMRSLIAQLHVPVRLMQEAVLLCWSPQHSCRVQKSCLCICPAAGITNCGVTCYAALMYTTLKDTLVSTPF